MKIAGGVKLLPEGFPNLVLVSIENWDWDILPQNDSQVWDALLYTVFLGRTVRTAQANYAKNLLDPYLNLDVAQDVRTDMHWNERVEEAIDHEINSVQGTSGEGFKRAILNTVAQQVRNFDLIRTVDSALSFFEANNIGVDLIEGIRDNDYETRTLVAHAASEIFNVSYIKAVLWLYGCGIARNLVPPNSHVKRFLAECGCPGFGWSREEPEDWQIFTLACSRMCDVAQEVSDELGRPITPKQAQAAVWYLQTCRGLLSRKYARHLSPSVLIDFLHMQRWDVNDLDSAVGDIEELEGLAEALGDFMEIILRQR